MRTSLEEIKYLEHLILQPAEGEEPRRLMSVKQKHLISQRIAYLLIRACGRRKLKQRLQLLEESLFNDVAHTSFQHQVNEIFKS